MQFLTYLLNKKVLAYIDDHLYGGHNKDTHMCICSRTYGISLLKKKAAEKGRIVHVVILYSDSSTT